jgi:hypothetical protein
MGKPAPIRGSLSDVRVTVMIMRVLIVKSLCQVAMSPVPELECMLPGASGCMWLRLVIPSTKWHCFLRTQLQQLSLVLERPLGMTARGPGAC